MAGKGLKMARVSHSPPNFDTSSILRSFYKAKSKAIRKSSLIRYTYKISQTKISRSYIDFKPESRR